LSPHPMLYRSVTVYSNRTARRRILQHCRITKRSGVGIAVATKSYCTRIANFSRHNLGSHNGWSQVR
jgi:hypothetical protein